jgi:hypothetical protein
MDSLRSQQTASGTIGRMLSRPFSCRTTLRGNQGRHEIAAAGGADRRSAR